MPSSPASFITPSSLVAFQRDLKAHINSFPLVKVSLTMRPLIKKRPSNPFSLTLKRHSTAIFSRSSSSSDASTSADCTPALEKMDPISMNDVAIDSSSEAPLHITVSRFDVKQAKEMSHRVPTCAPRRQPSIGTKIVDRFWPEDEAPHPEESCRVPVPSCYATALAPPPHHRRAPRSLGSICDVSFRYVTLLWELGCLGC